VTVPQRIWVTVDVALLTVRDAKLSLLLIQRKHDPFEGHWALPGGFVDPEEAIDVAARRELQEETGVGGEGVHGHLEQLGTYGDPGRDPRGRTVSVVYVAMLRNVPAVEAADDAADARWWPIDDLAPFGGAERLAFDHDTIVADAVERARSKLEYTPLATAFCDEPFTIGELRGVYEVVWGEQLDPADFRRAVLSTPGFVRLIGETAGAGTKGGRSDDHYGRGIARVLHPALLRPSNRPAPEGGY
jgi:8-oxo-dGTP diphosphatase